MKFTYPFGLVWMHCFRNTTAASEDGDKFVQLDEFRDLLMNLFFQAKLTFAFTKIDKNHDGKVSFAEFCKGTEKPL